jgi:hypothetical protein
MLFWNPGCGFCTRMIDDLKAWEERRAKDARNCCGLETAQLK